jgi:hypothetical protein
VKRTTPALRVSTWLATAARDAAPPTWKGAHGQLRARLANRLRGNHPDRFADIDRRTTAKVATIALGAKTVTCLAGQRRTCLDFVDPQLIDQSQWSSLISVPCSMTVS